MPNWTPAPRHWTRPRSSNIAIPPTSPFLPFPSPPYLNAFRPQSTFARESHQEGLDRYHTKEEQGAIDIKSIAAEGYGDLAQSMRFTSPDDGNQDDHTVMEITLPKPLAPGGGGSLPHRFSRQVPTHRRQNRI